VYKSSYLLTYLLTYASQSVCLRLSVRAAHDRVPCKNGRTDRDAVFDVDLGASRESCITSWCRLKSNSKRT